MAEVLVVAGIPVIALALGVLISWLWRGHVEEREQWEAIHSRTLALERLRSDRRLSRQHHPACRLRVLDGGSDRGGAA